MAFNPSPKEVSSVTMPLASWGGLVTDQPPANLPNGVSPDNQECAFTPNSCRMRGGLLKVLDTTLGSVTVTYGKSYVDNQGVYRNLYLDSAGNLWVENVSTSPGSVDLLGTTTPGSYAQSITAFGREYLAISDTLHGSDVPLQFDGVNLDRVTQDGPGGSPTVVNTVIAKSAISSLTRAGNVVTAVTGAAHNLKVGYLAQVSEVPATGFGGGGGPITIDTQDFPGIATMECGAPHGLAAGMQFNIFNVQHIDVSGGIVSISRQGQVVTVITTAAHGLTAGAEITVNLVPTASFNATFLVQQIIGSTSFSYIQADVDAIDTSGVGQIFLNWPVPDLAGVFTVISCPTPTAVQFATPVFSNAVFPAANISYVWNGSFYVSTVVNATTFTYAQNGPDLTSGAVGNITPEGQIAPGDHQIQCMFLTRQSYITKGSPPVKFTANGGQYLTVSNLPIGPPNVVARILAFTGAFGAYFFYIPVPAQSTGQVVSTATQINDNTTTTVVLDFSDRTLFAGLGISIQGNNLANQIVLDGALGFKQFGDRLCTFGQRNRIQNLQNLTFDGGYFPSAPTLPTGWTPVGGGGGVITTGHYGFAFALSGSGSLKQSFYEDAYSAPIGTPNATYLARAWLSGGGSATLTISSASTGFSTSATISGTGFVQANFGAAMPPTIPVDMILSLSGSAIIDEISIIYADSPYLDQILFGSYVDNPEAFDGLSGKFGPTDDTRKVMGAGIIRAVMYILTRDPSGRMHQVANNGVTEPAGWNVSQIAANCGLLSAFALTESQADDASAGGGEEWLAWASLSGARIFGGDQPWKISQEIQPDWSGDNRNQTLFPGINSDAFLTTWCMNDPTGRVIYFGLPIGPTASAPTMVYPVDYRDLDSAVQIAQGDPIRGRGGPSRKWTRWNLTMNGAALMYRAPGRLEVVVLVGNGVFPGSGGFGNVYTLNNPLFATDDDFGLIPFYYVTYFFPSVGEGSQLGLGAGRLMLQFFQCSAAGPAGIKVTILRNALSNPWPYVMIRTLQLDPTFDLEWPGASAVAQRMAFKFEAVS